MSVSLTPINDLEGDSLMDCGNVTWSVLTEAAGIPWNGTHDPQTYTPEQLRAIAKAIPATLAKYNWHEPLEALAQAGGAELS